MTGRMRLAWLAGLGDPADLPAGARDGAWTATPYADLLRSIEQAGVDFVVLREGARRTISPAVMAGALGAATRAIGLVPSAMTTDYPPYMLARLMVTLQHVTEGRSGWAIDTGLDRRGAHGYGLPQPLDPALHDAMAGEYLDVCRKLWASWAPGALVEDARAGIFADPAKVQPIHHAGRFFRVQGPLNTTPFPDGPPMLVQVVADAAELDFAARQADLVILCAADLEAVRRMRQAVHAQSALRDGRAAAKVYLTVDLRVGETPEAVADWPAPNGPPALALAGPAGDVVAGLEAAFEASGCDGIVIRSDWSAPRVAAICGQVIGLLRRRGSVAPACPAARTFRDRVLG